MSIKRILLVDDDETFRIIVREAFSQAGYSVIEAPDGSEAQEKIKETNPHLILLDVMMPDVDGISLCREIRKSKTTKDVPIFIVSALGDSAVAKEALKNGATAYVVKPVDMAILLDKIKKVLN